jgi:hypothetical protein
MNSVDRETSYSTLNEILVSASKRPDIEVTSNQLLALHRRWNAALSARLDLALEGYRGNSCAPALVAEVWLQLRYERPVLRALLERHRSRPDLQPVIQQELRFLALAAQLSDLDDPLERAAANGRNLLANLSMHVSRGWRS